MKWSEEEDIYSKWLQTHRVMLNTIRWSSAYLCVMGEGWSVDAADIRPGRECKESLELFFPKKREVCGLFFNMWRWT